MTGIHRHRTTLVLTTALALAALAGCGNELTDPSASGIGEEARSEALSRAEEVLASTELSRTASTVEDLTGGFAVGLADEATGLDMELGESFTPPAGRRLGLSAGANLVRLREGGRIALRDPRIRRGDEERLLRAPGDLILQFTETNADGSISEIRIFEGESDDEVRIERHTTWPNGNLALTSIDDEIVVDLGADRSSEVDDTWSYLRSTLHFVGGASLERELDLREQGGLVDDVRAEIVSVFTPRPQHPFLRETVTTLVVDLHAIDDESDDRFVSIERRSQWLGVAHDGSTPRLLESLVLEQPVAEGEEPCGGTLTRDIRFREDRRLVRWSDEATWACAGGGSLERRLEYEDGAVDAFAMREDTAGIVHLDATRRDGTTLSGRFDEAARSFEITTRHPAGSDPVQRDLQGSTAADGSSWQLDEQVLFLDGFVERNHLEASEGTDERRLAGTHDGREESVSFELRSDPADTRLVGFVENDREQRVEFEIERLADGGALVDFVATEPGLTVEGHLDIQPTGCGNGTLIVTENESTTTLEIEFCEGDVANQDLLTSRP